MAQYVFFVHIFQRIMGGEAAEKPFLQVLVCICSSQSITKTWDCPFTQWKY